MQKMSKVDGVQGVYVLLILFQIEFDILSLIDKFKISGMGLFSF